MEYSAPSLPSIGALPLMSEYEWMTEKDRDDLCRDVWMLFLTECPHHSSLDATTKATMEQVSSDLHVHESITIQYCHPYPSSPQPPVEAHAPYRHIIFVSSDGFLGPKYSGKVFKAALYIDSSKPRNRNSAKSVLACLLSESTSFPILCRDRCCTYRCRPSTLTVMLHYYFYISIVAYWYCLKIW